MKWTDVNDIAIELVGVHPEVDPLSVRFTDLREWVMGLPEFDDDPEITAYIQVKDLTSKNNDEVFVFNGWMFSSSPSIAPFDHPVYDVWLTSCY